MTIPAPVANYGDQVEVENYRCNPRRYEAGRVVGLRYQNQFGGRFTWSYDVMLERRTKSDYAIRLYVSDEQIERIEVTP